MFLVIEKGPGQRTLSLPSIKTAFYMLTKLCSSKNKSLPSTAPTLKRTLPACSSGGLEGLSSAHLLLLLQVWPAPVSQDKQRLWASKKDCACKQ